MKQGYRPVNKTASPRATLELSSTLSSVFCRYQIVDAGGNRVSSRTKNYPKSNNAIAQTEEKGSLDLEQQKHIKRTQTQLANLKNLPKRPHRDLYKGNPSIILGVSLGLEKPVTVALVDVVSGRVLTYRSAKQLLGKNHKLLNRQKQEKLRLSIKRHKAQKKNAPNHFGESNLGKYIDRLFADAIIELARSFQANSIVLPEVKQIREITQSEVRAKAERKNQRIQGGSKKLRQTVSS